MAGTDERGTFLDTVVIFFGELTDTFRETLTGDTIIYLVIGLILLYAVVRPF